MPNNPIEDISRAAQLIRDADSLIITAGAGMGVDSGMPDFRGNEGLWNAYPALGKARIAFTSMASPDAFMQNPELAWGFYAHRLLMYRRTNPHHGFHILKHWGEKMTHGYNVFTSNVDGQFQKAGFDPNTINECHGSIHYLQCMKPCSDAIWEADALQPTVDDEACLITSPIPTCPNCGGMARPNILMFGDWHWNAGMQDVQSSRMRRWLGKVRQPVCIELGAGTAVPTVRRFSQIMCDQLGGHLIRLNIREPEVDRAQDVGIPVGALSGLEAIAEALGGDWLVPRRQD